MFSFLRTRPKGRTIFIASAVLVAAVLVLFSVASSRKPPVLEVRVCHPSRGDVIQTISTGGKVRPIEDFQARANFPGMVEKIFVDVGDKVSPGQVLIEMKDPFAASRVATANSALRAAQASSEAVKNGGTQEERIAITGDLEHAELAESNASKSLAAIKLLNQQGAASAAEVSAAQQKLADAEASLRTLQQRSTRRYSKADVVSSDARVRDAQASLTAANIAFANANIAAPKAGVVYSVLVSPYDFVPMGAELLHVADLNHMEVRAFFDEPDIGELAVGQPVKIVWDAKPNKVWNGHIKRAPLAAMPLGSRNVADSIIAVDDAKEDLLPNTNVTVTVTVHQRHNVLYVPREALHADGAARFVFRVIDGRLVQTPVTVGIANLDRVEILSGLDAESVVALNSMDGHDLHEGAEVVTVDAAKTQEGHLSTHIMPIEAGLRWADALMHFRISSR